MSVTFAMFNGDVQVSSMNGKPTMIGNDVTTGANDPGQSALKTSQDMIRCLSLPRLPDGTTAALDELQGATGQIGADSTSMLITQYIREMFSNILVQQQIRANTYTAAEQFNKINNLQVSPSTDQTSYFFFLSAQTVQGSLVTQNGVIDAST